MKIILTGGRHRQDVSLVETALNLCWTWSRNVDQPLVVVHGDCRSGPDQIGRKWAEWMELTQLERVTHVPYPADWHLGRRAGRVRNEHMVNMEWRDTDLCVAFPHTDSIGTLHCMQLCRDREIPVWEMPAGCTGLTAPPALQIRTS